MSKLSNKESFNFNKKGQLHKPIKYWELSDGNYLIIYQGSRGANPDLDFIVKYKEPSKRLRAPSHTHWIVDLIIKANFAPDLVREYITEWLELYDKIEPFKTKNEREEYEIIYSEYFTTEYYSLDNLGHFSTEFLSSLIELFIKCEKQTPNAFMFKNLLILIKQFCKGEKDFYQVISYSKRV